MKMLLRGIVPFKLAVNEQTHESLNSAFPKLYYA